MALSERHELQHRPSGFVEKEREGQISPSTFKDKLRDVIEEIIAGGAVVLVLAPAWLECRLHRSARERRNSGESLSTSRKVG